MNTSRKFTGERYHQSKHTVRMSAKKLCNRGHKAPTISHLLHAERLSASPRGMHKFLTKYLQTGSIARCPGSGRPSKIMEEVKTIIDEQMSKDYDTTAYQLYHLLVSFLFTHRCQSSLGWTFVVLCTAN